MWSRARAKLANLQTPLPMNVLNKTLENTDGRHPMMSMGHLENFFLNLFLLLWFVPEVPKLLKPSLGGKYNRQSPGKIWKTMVLELDWSHNGEENLIWKAIFLVVVETKVAARGNGKTFKVKDTSHQKWSKAWSLWATGLCEEIVNRFRLIPKRLLQF